MWPEEKDLDETKGPNEGKEDWEEIHALERTGEKVSLFRFEQETAKFSTEILPWLFLGNADNAASKREVLELKGFVMTHCLACRGDAKTPWNIKYKVLNMINSPSEDLYEKLKKSYDFIDNVRKTKGAKLLVYCDGTAKNPTEQSRAAAIIIGYLMMSEKIGYKAAEEKVQKARKKMFQKPVKPNHGFVQQLKKLELETTLT